MRDIAGTRYSICLMALMVLLWFPSGAALAQVGEVANFDQLVQIVSNFEQGTRPDIAAAQCTTQDPQSSERPFEGADLIFCQDPVSPIVDSGWDIAQACAVTYVSGAATVGFTQSGVAGDGDGDGDPNFPGNNFDSDGIGHYEAYAVTLDNDVTTAGAEFSVRIGGINVGGHNEPDRGPSSGALCLRSVAGLSEPAVAGPMDLGCDPGYDFAIGEYSAGNSGHTQPAGGAQVSKEILLHLDNIADLPSVGRELDPDRLFVFLSAGSNEPGETCGEDYAVLRLIPPPHITLEKSVFGSCGNQVFTLTATYEIRNDGFVDFDSVLLEDHPLTDPDVSLDLPDCWASGASIIEPPTPVSPGSEAFRLRLSSLPASDFDLVDGNPFPGPGDNDCGNDGVNDESCGLAVVTCAWSGSTTAEQIDFVNDAKAEGLVGDDVGDDDDATAGVTVTCPVPCTPPECPTTGTRKEHEGVGYDNRLALTRTIPYGDTNHYGSNVEPGEKPKDDDAAPEETFRQAGVNPVIGQPGVFANLPKIPPGMGMRPQFGAWATFNWKMYISSNPFQFAPLDITCTLCSEKAWRKDGSPGQTFVPDVPTPPGAPPVLANTPIMMTVSHTCGPIHPAGCSEPLDALTTPGLDRRNSGVMGDNSVTFVGCLPTVVQIDPASSGHPIMEGDYIEVRITVPGNERTVVHADVTSCEVAYLTADPE
jgi:hypothetical protein